MFTRHHNTKTEPNMWNRNPKEINRLFLKSKEAKNRKFKFHFTRQHLIKTESHLVTQYWKLLWIARG